MIKKTETLTIRLTSESRQQLNELAKTYHKTITDIIVMLVNKEYLENTKGGQSDLLKAKKFLDSLNDSIKDFHF